jgi:hypothetical protein
MRQVKPFAEKLSRRTFAAAEAIQTGRNPRGDARCLTHLTRIRLFAIEAFLSPKERLDFQWLASIRPLLKAAGIMGTDISTSGLLCER